MHSSVCINSLCYSFLCWLSSISHHRLAGCKVQGFSLTAKTFYNQVARRWDRHRPSLHESLCFLSLTAASIDSPVCHPIYQLSPTALVLLSPFTSMLPWHHIWVSRRLTDKTSSGGKFNQWPYHASRRWYPWTFETEAPSSKCWCFLHAVAPSGSIHISRPSTKNQLTSLRTSLLQRYSSNFEFSTNLEFGAWWASSIDNIRWGCHLIWYVHDKALTYSNSQVLDK